MMVYIYVNKILSHENYYLQQNGTVNVWTVDARGTLSATRQYRRKGEITAAVFCTLPPRPDSRKKDWKKTYSPSFFIGTDKGGVVYADDLGHCTEVNQLTSPIDKMLFYEDSGKLVILTKSLMLTQFHVAEDGKVSKLNQVKISIPQDGLNSLVWAGSGLLAAATQEKMVRVFNISSEENYNILLPNFGGDRLPRVVSVAFNPIDRYLAAGTDTGHIAIWKYCGPVALSSLPSSSAGTSEAAGEKASASAAQPGSSSADWEVR
jgi:intraflagellar transport protein 140